jgi:putative transposase
MSQFDYRSAYRRNLPHIQPPGATFFIRLRLGGSIPQSVIRQWGIERRWPSTWLGQIQRHYDQIKDDFERTWFKKFELLLDGATVGPVWLKCQRVASVVAEALHHRHGRVYRLDAFTIMANHVHTIIKPLPKARAGDVMDRIGLAGDAEYHSLAAIMQSLKGYTAFEANRILGRVGEFWAHESYDHWIRNDQEWQRTVAYVINNPLKAGYVKRWQDWQWNYRRVKS